MPEWSNGVVSKTTVRATVPRVRIPVSPPASLGPSRYVRNGPSEPRSSAGLRRLDRSAESGLRREFTVDWRVFSVACARATGLEICPYLAPFPVIDAKTGRIPLCLDTPRPDFHWRSRSLPSPGALPVSENQEKAPAKRSHTTDTLSNISVI
jgi:hypothetical protein